MQTMTWNHTRTGKPMKMVDDFGVLWARAMMIRFVYTGWPIKINGKNV